MIKKLHNLYKIPFYIGGVVSWFVFGRYNRRRVRGNINVLLYHFQIAKFIKQTYGEKTKKIRLVRQVSMNRMTCIVNDRYYVKIFRDVNVSQLNNFKFLLDFVQPHLSVLIPKIFVAQNIPMYVADKLPGKVLRDFDKKLIMKNEMKIKKQIIKMIDDMQNISVKKIPEPERFLSGLQEKQNHKNIKIDDSCVLAHQDLNASNFLLDDKLNLVSVVDWDSLSIVPNRNIDRQGFEKLWTIYKNSN